MKKKIKLIKISGIVLLIIICSFGIFSLNSYLKNERLLIYAKGTNKKAFLNATWKMSVKEVERANNCKLTKGYDFTAFEPTLNKLLESDRIQWEKSSDVNILDGYREVSYNFFDDKLFRVIILGDIFNKKMTDSLTVTSLEPKYGKIERSEKNEYEGKFITKEVEVNYSQFEYTNEQNKLVKRFKIEITYKPLLNEIKSISEKEQNNIF